MFKRLQLIVLLLSLNILLFAQIPAGYYNAAVGLSGENLRTALKTIITNGSTKISYSNIWNFYDSTDCHLSPNQSKIWDMYSDVPGGTAAYYYTFQVNQCGTANSEGDCYSREHCVPNSWWGGFDDAAHPQYSDLHHLFPADQYVNGYKSAHPIGQVGTASFTSTNGSKVGPCSYPGYTGTVFEPINAYKGDFARAYLYIATRYKDSIGAWAKNFPSTEASSIIDTASNNFKTWFINMMLAWHIADTVSSKEINRNNVIYRTAQHNRNPFVDHPEYVAAIWGGSQLIKQEPTNHATNFQAINTAPLNSTITLNWTDATGTVLPDGYLIRISSVGFNQIANPTDSIAETTNSTQIVISQGIQTASFSGLLPGTTYYFKIFPFTNAGSNINFKTTVLVPTANVSTSDFLWKEDFETGSKGAYAIDTINCSMGRWIFSNALIGNSTSDRKNSLQSARLLDANLYMNFDKTGGADSVWVYHGRYGNNGNSSWRLQISTDGGINWNNIGNLISTTDTNLTAVAFAVKQIGNVRFNIQSYSNSNRLNIDDITISNFSGFTPPVLTADVSNNNADNNIDISFTDNAGWRSAITAVKINGNTLTPTTDYVISAANIQLKPSGGNPLLTAAGTKTITIEAATYINDTVVQQINAGVPTINSTVSITAPLAKNTSQTLSCTARDQYNNPVSAYNFKYDLLITNNNASTTETYTIDGTARTATINNVSVVSASNTNGIATFTASLPSVINPGDGISIQLQLSDGSTNIGSSYQFTELYPQSVSFGSLGAQTYGNAKFRLNATATSGLAVSFSSSNPAVASISGDTVTIINVGSTNITASQTGNSTYYPASDVIQNLTINQKALTITGAAATSKIYDGTNAAVITGSLNGVTGTDIVNLNGSGIFADVNVANGITVSSTASLTGTDAYKYTLTQPTGLTANITKASQTINFGALAAKTINDADFSPAATSPTSAVNPITFASSNSAVATILSNQIHITGAGTSTITASQSGNTNYNAAADVMQTLTVTSGPEVLAAWNLTGVGSTTLPTFAATTFSTYLISTSGANNITRGSTAAWSTGNNSFRTVGFKNEGISTANTDYFQFTLQASSGKKLSLSSIDANFNGTQTYVGSGGVSSQFAYSTDGTNFTLIGSPQIFTATVPFLNMPQINLSAISALQNVNNGTTITFRFYASGQTTTGGWGFYSPNASTNGLAIGGNITSVNPPALAVSALSSFGNQCINTTSNYNSFTISGSDLTTSTITVAPLSGYTYATTSGGTYTATLSIAQSGGSFSQDIYVKLLPTAVQSYNGDIVISGGGATSVLRSVTGSGITTVGGSASATTSPIIGGNTAEITLSGNTGSIVKWQKSFNAASWTDVSPASITNPYYPLPDTIGNWSYRAVVQNAGCNIENSTQADIILNANTTTFTQTAGNDWNTTGNWSNGIPTKSYNVTIPANLLIVVNTAGAECNNLKISPSGKLTINSSKDLTVYCVLTMESDAGGSASFVNNGNFSSGANMIQQYLSNALQYHAIGAPVNSQSIDSIKASSDSLYVWDENSGTFVSYTASNFLSINGSSSFIPAKAYAISCPANTAKNFSGNFNNGTINIPLTYSANPPYQGWNFIANPYPSAIDWDAASGWTRNMLENAVSTEKAIWVWNPITQNYGSYISNQGGTGTNGVSKDMNLAQGFWVKAATAGTLSMNNNVRLHSSQIYLKTQEPANQIRVKVSNSSNAYSDEVIVKFGNPTDLGGAEKMFSMEGSAPGLYTTKNNKNWSINYLGSINLHPEVALSFKAGITGNYTLHFYGSENFNYIYLEDKLLNSNTNILNQSTYNFYADISDSCNRFKLRFSPTTNNIKGYDISNTRIYAEDNEIIVSSDEKINQLIIYNSLGQLICLKDGYGNNLVRYKCSNNSLYYYIVKVVTAKDVLIKKIILE